MRRLLAIFALRTLLALGLFVLAWPETPFAADAAHVGFRTLGHYDQQNGQSLYVNVWYPATRDERELSYGLWEFFAAREAAPLAGRHPLLLLSHDTFGTRFSYHDTAHALAALGFVVAAPNHGTDNMDNMDDLLTLNQLRNRVRELSASLDLLLASPLLESSIDPQRIGLLGFGAGGTAALLLGGALPDCLDWPAYCAGSAADDVYCQTWAKQRLDVLCQQLPLQQSWADPRIKAVAVAGPSLAMLFSHTSFRYFYPPLLIIAAAKDSANPQERHSLRVHELLGRKPRYVRLPDADAGALMAPCSRLLASQLPELCYSIAENERMALHKLVHDALRDFFLQYLGDHARTPHIPQPPDLQKQEAPSPQEKPERGRRRR